MIYVIRDTLSGHVKIGLSEKPWVRFAKMRVDCPGELSMRAILDGERADEQALHRRFVAHRVRGEWFECSGALAEWLLGLVLPTPPVAGRRRTWGESGLTDDALAPLVGICRPQINKIRRGISVPSLPVALRIAQITGVSLESLMAPQPVKRAA